MAEIRTIKADRIFSVDALQLVNTLAQSAANINAIRSGLHKTTGVWYRDIEIIAAGKLFGHRLERSQAGAPPVVGVPAPAEKPRAPEKTARVPRGTFPVPPGGYRMGRSVSSG